MDHLDQSSPRKHSDQEGSQGEEYLGVMFPQLSTKQLYASLEMLSQNYDKGSHSQQLLNYCFRCHNSQFAELYQSFRRDRHPELEEPRVSHYYTNDCFVDLMKVGQYCSSQLATGKGSYPTPSIPPAPIKLHTLLDGVFTLHGCIPNLQRFLLFYPTYLEKHILVEQNLFQSGKVDVKIAYFLGIIGGAQLGSVYVMARMLKRFRRSGGDIKWLENGGCPPKLKKLIELNHKMARAIWQVNSSLLQDIVSGAQWTHGQLAMCVQILAFAHQMSTIALAVGLLTQTALDNQIMRLQQINQQKRKYDQISYPCSSKVKLALIIPKITQFKEEYSEYVPPIQQYKKPSSPQNVSMSKRQLKKSLRLQQSQQEIEVYMREIGNELTKQQLYLRMYKLMDGLLDGCGVVQKRREKEFPLIDFSDYNYKQMAYPVLNSLTHQTADKIRDLIVYSDDMTLNNFGSEKIGNTKQFRRAMRYYSENLCGYTHLEYDFKTNTSLLTIALKFYIRLLTLSPIHISKQVLAQMHHQRGIVECFDLGHVAVLIANGKMSLVLALVTLAFQL